ncbi:sialic acid-binding Ig-like lectin 5 isoform X2 [Anguilla anguilla]|nr:sialic acid-binding Ig-like lectin 5 isoform X2 [Anguilla anguilla]
MPRQSSFPAKIMFPTCSTYAYRLTRLLCLILAGRVLRALCVTWKLNVPKTISAVRGTCVVIPCQTGPHTRAVWYQYHSLRWPKVYDGLNPGSVLNEFRERTSVLGSPRQGNCSLRIDAVRQADDGVSLYAWINPDESSSQQFHKQTVALKVTGIEVPQISIQGPMTEGSLVSLNCSVPHSCPTSPPALVWAGLPEGHASSVTTAADVPRGVWVSVATASWRASGRDNGRMVACSVRLDREIRQVVRLDVSHAPVDVNLTAEMPVVKEGEAAMLRCSGDGNPPPTVYRWLERRGRETVQLNSSRDEVSVPRVWRDSSFSCVAQNPLGSRQSDWLSLNVQFSPVILPGSTCFVTGGALRCVFRVEASPNATLHWTVNNNDPPASFASVVEQKGAVTSAMLTGPLGKQQLNVSCTAYNPIGNVTYNLPINNTLSQPLSWVLPAVLCGCAILSAVLVFLYCKMRKKERGSMPGMPQVTWTASKRSDNQANEVSVEPLATYSDWPGVPLAHRTQDQAAASESKLSVDKVSLESSATYGNWTHIPEPQRTQDTHSDGGLIYENFGEPADMPSQ